MPERSEIDHSEWAEELPNGCPPSDSRTAQDEGFFRLISSQGAVESDFMSQRALNPEKYFNAPECITRSTSVFLTPSSCAKVRKFPTHKGKIVARILLSEAAGLVKQTFGDPNHYSWWRKRGFDPIQNYEVVETEATS